MDPHLPENIYCVSRPIYSNPAFEEDNERRVRGGRTLRERLSGYCGCSSRKAMQVLKGVIPVLDWLSKYPIRDSLLSDVISGVSTGLVCCLQGLAYALLVSVPPVYGLYSAFFPILTYFFLGTSRHISVGPFPVTCLMIGSVVLTLTPDDSFLLPLNGSSANETGVDLEAQEAQRIIVASTMTVLIGLFQVAMGLLQVGFLVRYLSDPLVGGFTTAAAFHVLISQIRIILSVPTNNHNGFFSIAYVLIDVFNHIDQTNMADLVAGLLTIVFVMAVKEINTRFQHKLLMPIPIEVIVTMVGAGISYAVDLDCRYGASIVKSIPRGFSPPQIPDAALFWGMLGSSFSTAVVGYAVAVSVAKVYAAKYDYTIDGNQELVAFGVSNVFTGCFSGFAASTALSRTAVQESTGGRSQVAGVVSAAMVMIVIAALGHLLEPLQKSVLAAIIVANLRGMFAQVAAVLALWRQSRADCLIWIVTCLASIVLGLDVGLLVGLLFEMGTVVIRTQYPACPALGNIPGTDIYRNMKDYKNVAEVPGVKIFKCSSPIYFANIDYFKDQLKAVVGFDPVRVFRKRSQALRKIHKLIKKGKLRAVENGTVATVSQGLDNQGFEDDMTLGRLEVDFRVDWASELPGKLAVPKVHIHSLVLDFSAVSFLDVVAVKSIKLVIKEFLRVGVNVYIAGCDDEIIRSLEALAFFDEVVTKDLLFLSVHDAVLFIRLETYNRSLQHANGNGITVMQENKEPLPFAEEEDLIEAYDNEHEAMHGLSS
ncbi:hypothetical protein MATL_G00249690 [Megalops atlanticus]|uniref:STAS domain-containing protein n=1 Tax=Megalops atlanticus TaxID=7932 RepID=A0A9D3T0S1_MEGAT|nr:hypothetical protein MATL_G00249690 [Megalops atlanticus]